MKTKAILWSLNLLAAVAVSTALQAADNLVRYMARPGGSVVVEGTSTIHDWSVEGKIIGGYFMVEPAFQTDLSLKSVKSLTTKEKNPKAVISIPIRSLKSGKDTMDRIMQEAMKADKHPMIRFTLKEMVVKGDVPASGSPVTFATKGDLSVSGVTKEIEMDVTMERKPEKTLVFQGQKQLKMTDFGITPPSPKIPGLGSIIKTGDEVTVKFTWIVKAR